jgi:hypothetical protein
MKYIKIPYNYRVNPAYQISFGIFSLNEGMTCCKRLGFEIVSIVLGKRELKEVLNMSYSGDMRTTKEKQNMILNRKIVKSRKESELAFNCVKI